MDSPSTSSGGAQVLSEAAQRGDITVVEPALALLRSDGLSNEERELLILSLEQVVVPVVQRVSFAEQMWTEAKALRAKSASRAALWSAIRQWRAIVSVTMANHIVEFLRSEDVLSTRQVAIQSVQSLYECATDSDLAGSDALRLRINVLLEKYLDPDLVSATPEQTSFVINTLAAAAAMRDPKLVEFTTLFTQRMSKLMLKQLASKLSRVNQSLLRLDVNRAVIQESLEMLAQNL